MFPGRMIHGKTALHPSISNLPSFRVVCNYAFENVGVDYAGPIYVRDNFSASKEMHKSYILLFTCATSRGVHLELTPNTNTTSFVMALRRFIVRRGLPNLLISDNFKIILVPSRI